MTDEETKQLTVLLDTKWKKKFDDDDLLEWAKAMSPYPYETAATVLAEIKVNQERNYAPRLKHVVGLVKSRLGVGEAAEAAAAMPVREEDSAWVAANRKVLIHLGYKEMRHGTPAQVTITYMRNRLEKFNKQNEHMTDKARRVQKLPAVGVAYANAHLLGRIQFLLAEGTKCLRYEAGVIDPATAEWYAKMALGTAEDFQYALDQARQVGRGAATSEDDDAQGQF